MGEAGQRSALGKALWRGFRMRCPRCGEGHLFRQYLKVADHCPACGEAFHHHRADDFPAYLVILIVGHLVLPAVLIVEEAFAPPLWLQYVIWLPLVTLWAVGLLQPVKGAVVALQWQLGMHGFARSEESGPMHASAA
jgi:uncharacterized protein (DUF983 family)